MYNTPNNCENSCNKILGVNQSGVQTWTKHSDFVARIRPFLFITRFQNITVRFSTAWFFRVWSMNLNVEVTGSLPEMQHFMPQPRPSNQNLPWTSPRPSSCTLQHGKLCPPLHMGHHLEGGAGAMPDVLKHPEVGKSWKLIIFNVQNRLSQLTLPISHSLSLKLTPCLSLSWSS